MKWSLWSFVALAVAGSPRLARASEAGAEDGERRPVETSADATQIGPATWIDARVDAPVGPRWTLFPQAALLRVASLVADTADEWHPFVGAGVAWEPGDPWRIELSGLYAPPAYDVESVAGEIEVERDIGDAGDHSESATFELKGSLTVKYVRWEDGMGPSGPELVQAFGDLQPVWRPTPRLEIAPRARLFVYDKALDRATGDRLGSIAVLARVGTFAPAAMAEAGVGYAVARWLTPTLQASEIVYASGVGSATQGMLGARVKVIKGWTVSLAGGWLWNRVGGPLVPPDALLSLPVARIEVSGTF